MNDGEKFANIVCGEYRAEMKHLLTCLQVDTLIFHHPWVARAPRIDGPRIGFDISVERQDGVGAIVGRVY